MVKKRLMLLLVVTMIITLITACGGNNANNGAASNNNGSGAGNGAANDQNGSGSEGEMTEMTIHLHDQDLHVFKDDWPVWQEVTKMTNVKLHGVAPPSATSSKEVFNMMIASGELPDIIHGAKLDMNKVALDGALEPLDDLIAEHAPNIQKFFEENPQYRAGSVASDGKLYFIPYVMDGEASMGFFIRTDWLKKLNLEVPKTIDEYYNVLKAFREQDPNGNGEQDEVPYFSRDKTSGIDMLIPLYGVRPNWHTVDGKVQYGKAVPEYENAMVNLAKWYKEGLIDKEIYTRGSNARDILFDDNVGGAIMDWFASSASYNDKMQEKVEGFEFLPMLPPADVNGKVWHEWSRELLKPKGWGIASTSKKKVEAIKFFDFFFTEEGRRVMNFGVEGQQYDMIDGKPIFKDSVLNGAEPVNKQLWNVGAQMEVGYQQDNFYEQQWSNPIAIEGSQMYIEAGIFAEQFPPVTFTPEEEKVISQKWPSIETYIREVQQRWIMGSEPIEGNFEQYMARLKDMGMDEVTAIYQAAYDRYQANVK